MSTYRLVAIDDDGAERNAGLIDTLTLPPNAALILSVSPDMLDVDMVRLRGEVKAFFGSILGDRPVAIIRAGDVKFLRLVPVDCAE